jgi:enoyl-CoA hydratase/carnithine racemase
MSRPFTARRSASDDAAPALRAGVRRPDTRFALPFTRLGLVPEFASSYLLPLFAGYHRAAELLLLGETFDAAKADAAGFITRVLPAGEVLNAAREAARSLAALPAKSVQRTKALMRGAHAAAVQSRMKAEIDEFRPMLSEPAARAALERFPRAAQAIEIMAP